jgi:arylsulfatase A-like enzyme
MSLRLPALNIIEMIWHDLGDWLSCYRRPDVPSPCLQRLADEGVVFENHFCTAPSCSPSRASIKTGLYPQTHGILGLTHRGWRYRTGIEPRSCS